MLGANNIPGNIDLEIREKWIVKFYNRLSNNEAESLNEIPVDDLEFLSSIPYEAIVTPFILEKNNQGRRGLAKIYNVGEGYIRGIIR